MTLLFVGVGEEELLGAEVFVDASVEVKAGVICVALGEDEPDFELLVCSEVVWRVEGSRCEDVDRWEARTMSLELAETSVALDEESLEFEVAIDTVSVGTPAEGVRADENGGEEDGRKSVEVKESP